MTEPPIDDPRLLSAYRKMLALATGLGGISGVDIGYTYDDGGRPGELGVRVHMSTAATWSKSASALPRDIDGVTVSLLGGSFRLHRDPRCPPVPREPSRVRLANPIKPGVSVGNDTCPEGTLGLIVDHAKGACILTCAHVLVGTRPGTRGIEQPHRGEKVADLESWFVDEDGDAAIAVLNGARRMDPAQDGTEVVISTSRMPRIGEIVTKSGLSTAVTCGMVDGAGRYLLLEGGNELFPEPGRLAKDGMDGFRIVRAPGRPQNEEISKPGDSGSVWYAHDELAGVGLHVAGERGNDSDDEERGIACYLPVVLERFGVTPAVTGSG